MTNQITPLADYDVDLVDQSSGSGSTHASPRYVTDFVTAGNGTALSPWTSASGTGGIQEAYNSLNSTVFGEIYAPAGFYLITNPVNFAVNIASTPSDEWGTGAVIFRGEGSGNTILVGSTRGNGGFGSTVGVVFDCTGAGHVTLRDFAVITRGASNKSTLAILFGRSTAGNSQFSQQNVVENFYVEFDNDATANNGHGTVGIYGRAVEASAFSNNLMIADTPYVFTGDDVFGIVSPNVPVNNTFHFCTANAIEGGQINGFYSAILLQGNVQTTSLTHLVCQKAGGATGTHAVKVLVDAINPSQPIHNLYIQSMQVEDWSGVISTSAPLLGGQIHGSYSQDSVGTNPGILLVGAEAELFHCEINLSNTNDASVQKLIGDDGVVNIGAGSNLIHVPTPLVINATNTPDLTGNVYIPSTATVNWKP